MQQWIYVLKPTRLEMLTAGSTPEEAATVSRHFAYLQDLTAKGVMILMGRTQNNDESTLNKIRSQSGFSVPVRKGYPLCRTV